MRVGVMRSSPWSVGGSYQYEMLVLDALAAVAARGRDAIAYLAAPDRTLYNLLAQGGLDYRGIPLVPLREPWFDQEPPERYLRDPATLGPPPEWFRLHEDAGLRRAVERSGVDWVFQLSQSPVVFATSKPFVMPIHDLQHRLQPEFPEVGRPREIAFREYLFGNACRFATLVLVDSEQGREDVLRFYGELIDADRIRILPFRPPPRSEAPPDAADLDRVRAAHALPPRFFLYPAQFWRHKNHALIVEAVRRIADRTGERVPVVLCGSYADHDRATTFLEVMRRADALGVRDLVPYLGWVPDGDMPALYRLSAGLVMPTFFGPTNIPVLEAWQHDRPVITADIPGVREQAGDAALLVDPRDPAALADAMLRLWRDPALGATLAARGAARLATQGWDAFVDRVADIVEEAGVRLRTGRAPPYSGADFRADAGFPEPPTGTRTP